MVVRDLPSGTFTLLVDVLVDERGQVEEAALRNSLHRFYDAIVHGRRAKWTYRPASRNGQPVKYRRTVAIVVHK